MAAKSFRRKEDRGIRKWASPVSRQGEGFFAKPVPPSDVPSVFIA